MLEMLEKNSLATVDDLIEAFIHAGDELAELETERDGAVQEIRKLSLADDTPKKRLTEARGRVQGLSEQIDALRYFRRQARKRLVELIPAEAEARLNAISQELETLRDQEKKARQKFLEAVARAVVLQETYKGREMSTGPMGTVKTSVMPGLEFKPHNLDGEEGAFYRDIIEILRKEQNQAGPTIYEKREELGRERARLEKIRRADPRDVVADILGEKEKPAGTAAREPRHKAAVWVAKPRPGVDYQDQPVGDKLVVKPARMYPDGAPESFRGEQEAS